MKFAYFCVPTGLDSPKIFYFDAVLASVPFKCSCVFMVVCASHSYFLHVRIVVSIPQ